MKPSLFFGLRLEYDITRYEPLSLLALQRPEYSYETKDYFWIFPIEKVKEVSAILGKTIDFDKPMIEKIFLDEYKGKGKIDIVVLPDAYKVITVINKKEQSFIISKETVKVLWEVIMKYRIGQVVKTKTVEEHYCSKLGFTRFFRESGTFDFCKFNGTREDYFQFYYALKVLQHYGLIEHYKYGAIERLKEVFNATY